MCLSKTEMSLVNRNSSSVGVSSQTSLTFPRRRYFGAGAGADAAAGVRGGMEAPDPRTLLRRSVRPGSRRAGVERGDRPEAELLVEPDGDVVLDRKLRGDDTGALRLQPTGRLLEEVLPGAPAAVQRQQVDVDDDALALRRVERSFPKQRPDDADDLAGLRADALG